MSKRNILLARLYNRLSYYFCITEEKIDIKANEKTTIKELQEMLDEAYRINEGEKNEKKSNK